MGGQKKYFHAKWTLFLKALLVSEKRRDHWNQAMLVEPPQDAFGLKNWCWPFQYIFQAKCVNFKYSRRTSDITDSHKAGHGTCWLQQTVKVQSTKNNPSLLGLCSIPFLQVLCSCCCICVQSSLIASFVSICTLLCPKHAKTSQSLPHCLIVVSQEMSNKSSKEHNKR